MEANQINASLCWVAFLLLRRRHTARCWVGSLQIGLEQLGQAGRARVGWVSLPSRLIVLQLCSPTLFANPRTNPSEDIHVVIDKSFLLWHEQVLCDVAISRRNCSEGEETSVFWFIISEILLLSSKSQEGEDSDSKFPDF